MKFATMATVTILATVALFAATAAGLLHLWDMPITAANITCMQVFTAFPTLLCLGGVSTVINTVRA